MATVRGPFLSIQASGKIDEALIGLRRYRKNIVYAYAVPTDPKTPAQLAIRDALQEVVHAWGHDQTTTSTRSAWLRLARRERIRGNAYHMFIKEACPLLLETDHLYMPTNFYKGFGDSIYFNAQDLLTDTPIPAGLTATLYLGTELWGLAKIGDYVSGVGNWNCFGVLTGSGPWFFYLEHSGHKVTGIGRLT